MAGDARYRDGRGDTEENQKRRHQETAADSEHAGNESDRKSHGQYDEDVNWHVCDRKIDLQAQPSFFGSVMRRTGAPGPAKS